MFAAERCHGKPRGENCEQVENIQIPLRFCPHLPGMSHLFCFGLCREDTFPLPPCSQATPGRAVPPTHAFVMAVSQGGTFHRQKLRIDQPLPLQLPGKWEKPTLCPAQGRGSVFCHRARSGIPGRAEEGVEHGCRGCRRVEA